MKPPPHYHPILFTDEMVRAILEGRKTQTRRIIRFKVAPNEPRAHRVWWCIDNWQDGDTEISCPYGYSGDVLWVRQAWEAIDVDPSHMSDHAPGDELTDPMHYGVIYRADGPDGAAHSRTAPIGAKCIGISDPSVSNHWRPSIHMPFWACRLFLKVKAIRAERLQEITWADAVREGVANDPSKPFHGYGIEAHAAEYLRRFQELWDSINADRKANDGGPLNVAWDDNPWVWVIEFERYER